MTDAGRIALRLTTVGSCALSDALDTIGTTQALAGLRGLTVPGSVFAGRAVTVDLVENHASATGSHLGAEAVDSAGHGDVIVVANQGRTHCAGWGGLLSAAAARNGVEGVVIDGAARDVDEARAIGLPVVGREPTPVTARGRVMQRSWGEPVELCGVTVRPGDWIVSDDNGVVVVPADHLAQVLEVATAISETESALADELAAGRTVVDVMNARYEQMLSQRGDQ